MSFLTPWFSWVEQNIDVLLVSFVNLQVFFLLSGFLFSYINCLNKVHLCLCMGIFMYMCVSKIVLGLLCLIHVYRFIVLGPTATFNVSSSFIAKPWTTLSWHFAPRCGHFLSLTYSPFPFSLYFIFVCRDFILYQTHAASVMCYLESY